MIRTRPAILAGIALTFALVGCATQDGDVTSEPARGTNTPTAEAVNLAACEQALQTAFDNGTADMEGGEQPPECDGASDQQIEDLFNKIVEETFETPPESPMPIVTFGETVEYDDGLSASVSEPEPYEPSEYAAGAEGFDHAVIFTVRLVNGTTVPFDPSLTYLTAQSGNVEASEVFDSTEDGITIGGAPMTTLLPGRETEYQVVFAVADPDDIVLELMPGWSEAQAWDYQSAIFQTSGTAV